MTEATLTLTKETIPAFRNVVSVVWDNLHYQTNSSRPKPWNFKVCRIPFRGAPYSVILNTAANRFKSSSFYNNVFSVKKESATSFSINNQPLTLNDNNKYNWQWWTYNGLQVWRGSLVRINTLGTPLPADLVDSRFYYAVAGVNELGVNAWAFEDTGWDTAVCAAIDSLATAPVGQVYPSATPLTTTPTTEETPDATSSIEEANPAYVLLEVLVHHRWGLNYHYNFVDYQSFELAAQILYAEDMGISALWENDSTVEDFITMVLHTINAVLFLNPKTGKFTLRLIRAVKTFEETPEGINDLVPVADEFNVIEMRNFSRMGTAELTNQVTVQWTDPILGTQRSMTVHNNATREMQGAVVATTRQYPMVTSDATAYSIAARDLAVLSQPLAQVELVVNREFADIAIGDVFIWKWQDLGIVQMALRVLSVGYGLLEDGRITLKCVEDIFSADTSTFGVLLGEEFPNPNNRKPLAPIDFELINLNRVDILRLRNATYRGNTTQFDYVDEFSGVVAALAAPADERDRLFELQLRSALSDTALAFNDMSDFQANLADYELFGTYDFVPYAKLSVDINRTLTVLPIESGKLLHYVTIGSYLLCDGEYMEVLGFASDYTAMTVKRGVISTAPKKHLKGKALWFYGDSVGKVSVDTEWLADQAVAAVPLTVVGKEMLAFDKTLPAKKLKINADWANPYPPANIRILLENPSQLRISWDHRDAELLQDKLMGQLDGNMSGKTQGTYYAVRIVDSVGNIILDMPRYVGELASAGVFTNTYLHTLDDLDFAAGVIHIGVKTVLGDRASEWNWVSYDMVTPAVTTTELENAAIFGTYEPVYAGIADDLTITLSGNFEFDVAQSRFEFEGDTLELSFSTNIQELLDSKKIQYAQADLDSWFDCYALQIFNLEAVNEQGQAPLLATKVTRENKYAYTLSENTLDHGTPSPTLGFKVFVVDNSGNYSNPHRYIKTKSGVQYDALAVTTFASSTGLSVKGNAPREGMLAFHGTTATFTKPTTVKNVCFYVRENQAEDIAHYRYYEFDKSLNLITDITKAKYADFTGIEIVNPVNYEVRYLDPVTKTLKDVAK